MAKLLRCKKRYNTINIIGDLHVEGLNENLDLCRTSSLYFLYQKSSSSTEATPNAPEYNKQLIQTMWHNAAYIILV